MHNADRGIFDLRRGHPVLLSGEQSSVLVAAVEGLTPVLLDRLTHMTGGRPRLILTPHRASAMGWPQPLAEGWEGVALEFAPGTDPEALFTLASAPEASNEGEHPAHALDQAEVRPAEPAEVAALELARAGRLLPAVVSARVPEPVPEAIHSALADGMFLDVGEREARAVAHHPRLELAYVSEAPVPLADAPVTRFMLFREGNGILEHVAVVIGEPNEWPDAVPVRLHSACLTGDLFGSLRCDCGDQLRLGVKTINESGGGVLLYLAQEGRGIGLANKLRAYTMQTAGLDTIDSDCQLGFEADGRRYDAAVEMLEFLGIDTVRVLTNNPAKIEALRAGGIRVVAREPVHGTLNPHNLRYLSTKADRGGHWLQELLASEAERG
ncbi:GTP cyclohydrolase II [Thioalkalivibrio sp. K90mix]|uniref:GTP cyclohydrolase II RibA n=1 Tax=Thioalkalivibrio sp. (strain K90mix) TaxID=396595 RepID=UPI000195ABB2|nr:GTP cyclohydrolase II RibA [Thioalkalivibrio sp. K90mix]ADC71786.1 GTP cyclohydrolase II [Thioalkalivibrio sp. K90mix]